MKLKLLSFCIALSLSTFNLAFAEEMRSAAAPSVAPPSTADDCDDTDRACAPAGDLDGDGAVDSAVAAPGSSSSTGSAAVDALDDDCDGDSCASSSSTPASGSVDQDCGGMACDSPMDKQPPATMAPIEGAIQPRCEGGNCPASENPGQPSGMAINEKGLPGEKKPAAKDKTK